MHSLDIIIVNWNSGEQLRDCLASIAQTGPRSILGRVVVVDNASTDDSLAGVERIELPLQIVRNQQNKGFGAACNQGATEGHAEYLLFLNPDARLQPDSLTIPLGFLADPTQADVGICGIQLLNDDGNVARHCSRLPTAGVLVSQSLGLDQLLPQWFSGHIMTEWDHCATRTVDHVIGAFFLMRRTVFEQLGGFDERFFVYLEDLDFSLRAHQAGWTTVYLADAQAFHRGGGTSEQAKARRLFYSLRSRILYASKHFSRRGAGMVMAVTLLVEPWTRLVWSAMRLAPREAWETIGGYLLLWADMPRILTSIRQRNTIEEEG